MKKFLKISVYIIASVFMLLLLLLLFTQTGWFKSILKNEVEDIANENLNGTLLIENIEGSLFGDIEINEISIKQNEQQILFIKKAALDYSLWGLLSNSIEIDYIKIDSLFLRFSQIDDSTWNLNQLLKDSEPAVEENDTSSFNWNIELNLLQIKNSKINIQTIDTLSVIPKQINELNIKASASVHPELKKININNISFSALQPDINIIALTIDAAMLNEKIELAELSVETEANKVSASGNYFLDESGNSNIQMKTEPIHFEEFREFLPQLQIQLNPVLELKGDYKNAEGNIDVSIVDSLQKVKLVGQFSGIRTEPKYKAKLNFENINLSGWLNDSSAQSDINGKISAEGSGLDFESLSLSSGLKIENSKIMNRKLDSLILTAEIFDGDINADINLISEFGLIDGKFNLEDISGNSKINFTTNISSLNLAPIMLDESISSNLNFRIEGGLNGFSPETMNGSLSLSAGKSSFTQYPIDTLNAEIAFQSGSYSVEEFNAFSPAADVNVHGILSQTQPSDLSFDLEIKKLSNIPQLKKYSSISAAGKIEGNVKGYIDSLIIAAGYNIEKIQFEENSIESIKGKLIAEINKKGVSAGVNSSIEQIKTASAAIEKIELDAEYLENKISSTVNVTLNDTAELFAESKIVLDSAATITLNRFELNLLNQSWVNKKDSSIIVIADGRYSVSNFEFVNGSQKILVEGNAGADESDLDVEITNLKAGELLKVFISGFNASATIDTKLKLEGKLASPSAKGDISISDIQYEGNDFGDLSAKFDLSGNKFNWDFSLISSQSNIYSKGFIPIIIDADSTESVIPGDEPLSFNLKIDSLSLTELSKLSSSIDEIEGVIRSDIKFSNSLNNLTAAGYFKITDGVIESELLGTRYENFNLNFESEEEKFYLREFTIKSGDGTINIDGTASYKNGLLQGEFDELNVSLTADEFTAAETENYEAKIDGRLNFTNKSGEASFNGKIEILRSRFFLPYFTDASSGEIDDESEPILIRELAGRDSASGKSNAAESDSLKKGLTEYQFIRNINGQFTLVIPKNTWIVSPQLNIELSGEVDVIKSGEKLELFGNINVVRGKVEVYGKEFDVVEGKIFFSGGDKINPELAMTLEYMFRGADRNKQYLQIKVKGTPENPSLTFYLDDTQIDEGNAVSYLLFGKSLDQLTQSQRTNVSNSNTDLAKTIAGNFLASQLSSTVGSALGLDVIEIEGNNSWNSATLTAGKYLTDDLYVSYERGFGSTETNETNPRIVTLEYGITEFLYFQLVEGNDKNSGFDIILKFDW